MDRRIGPRMPLLALSVSALLLGACTSGSRLGGASAPAATPPPSPSTASSDAASTAPSATTGETPVPSAGSSVAPSVTPLTSDPLHNLTLVDVRTDEEFTIGHLAAEKPLLLEMMAIWCTNCRAQMHRVVEAHAKADFHSVGLDVDPSERAGDLKLYAARQGFEWPFALADADVAGLLRDRFGTGFLFPPNTPMIVLTPDGEVRALDFGGYGVDELLAELGV